MNGAKLLVNSLKMEGVKVIFGIPGLANMPFYDAMLEELERGEIRHVLMAHEEGAAHAADGYARALGLKVPGVCTATSGPGATNLVTGIATAYMDSSPVIAITGQVVRNSIGKMAFQEVDTPGIMYPVTKYTYSIKKTSEIPEVVKNSFYIATTGRPGPVAIDIPRDVQLEEIKDEIKYPEKPTVKGYRPFKEEVNLEDIKKAVKIIISSSKPIILVGTGALWSSATESIIKLSQLIMAPIVSTLPGKAAIPHDYPLYLGPMGNYGRAEANKAILESDLVIAIGSRFSDRTIVSYDEVKKDRKIVQINIDSTDLGKNMGIDVGIAGDARKAVDLILEAIKKEANKSDSKLEWIKRVKELKSYYESIYFAEEGKGLKPWKIMKTIRNSIPRNAIITTGVGQHQMWAETFFDVLEPGTFISSTGLGTMGFGFPAALGAKLARPDRVVIDLDGDGSFLMTGTNLATSINEEIPVTVVIFDNRTLGLVRQVQDLFQNKRIVGTDYGNSPDFVKFAKAFGAEGFEAKSYGEIERFLKQAISSEVTTIIRIPIDREELALPTTPPGRKLSEVVVSDPRRA
jgi:acetolactate synthase-1/2/3 large subunit